MNFNTKHLKTFFWFATIVLLLISCKAHADDILYSIGEGYRLESVKWFPKLLELAKSLFWKLAAIEFAWATILWALKNSEMQSFVASVVQKIIGIGFFYMLLQNADYWIPAIVNSLAKAGNIATNTPELTPSRIFDLGIDTAVVLLEGVKKLHLWKDPATIIIGGLSALAIVFSFLIIAGQMLIALIESYIVIGGGVLFLGFGGSRWTTDFTQKFISYAFAVGVKLFTLYLIIGVGTTQAEQWSKLLATTDWNNILTVLGASLLLAFLGFQIPNMAASMLSGSPSLTAGSAVGTTGSIAAGTVAAGAGTLAAGSGALQSARGGMQALKASYDHHRTSGSNPLSSALKAPLTSTLDMGREALGMRKGSLQTNTVGGAAAEYRQGQTAAMKERNAAGSTGSSTNDSSSNAGSNTSPPPDSGSAPTNSGSPDSPPSSGRADAMPDSSVSVANIAGGSGTKSSAVFSQSTATGKKPFENLKRVRAPQIPHDGAPSASVHIKLGHSED